MGSGKQSSSTSSNQTTTYTPTPEETALNKLQLEQAQAFDPTQRLLNQNAGNLINQLLTGSSDLPGWMKDMGSGISQDQMDSTVDYSLRDMNSQLAKSGAGTYLESGASQSIGARTAADLRNANQQFNLGNKFNLLNLATGNAAQIQQPMTATSTALGQRLAGLATVNTQGTSTTSSKSGNPFLSSFGSSLGSGAGSFFFGCWVASEIYGGWYEPRTVASRIYINLKAPKWFKRFYLKHGESIARFIHNKPILKGILKPLFDRFAKIGGYHG